MPECHQAGKKCLRDSQGEGCVGSLTPPQCLGDRLHQVEDCRVLGKVQYMEKGGGEVKPLPVGLEPG